MLAAALALVLSQTPVADRPTTLNLHNAKTAAANCPANGAVVASDPTVSRPNIDAGPRGGFPDMAHMPDVDHIYALDQTVDGCFTPKFVNVPGSLIITIPRSKIILPKPAEPTAPSTPGVR